LSDRTHIASPTVAKLLKQLHHAGLVNSTRGTRGGYQLARDPESISAAAILDALEGPIALTECSAGSVGASSARELLRTFIVRNSMRLCGHAVKPASEVNG